MIFVDTGGFFALLDKSSDAHEAVVTLFRDVKTRRETLLTTNAVIYETHQLVIARLRDQAVAMDFLEAIAAMRVDKSCEVVYVGEADEVEAIRILRDYDDKDFSYCDALSFAVMDRRGVTRAIGVDDHFRQYGNGKFELLPPTR